MNTTENKTALSKLFGFLEENGYLRIENKCFSNKFLQVSLDYIKFYGDMYDKIPGGWSEHTHGGIELVYEEIRRNPFLITLRIPFFGNLLENAEKMNEELKRFVILVSKKCDDCNYCIQTDKTGTRPKSCIRIDDYKICPIFCGFRYRWRYLNDDLVDYMIEMLKFADSILSDKAFLP